MGSHNILYGSPLLICLEGDVLVALLNMFFCLYSYLKPKEMVMHQVKHPLETYVANLIMTPSQGGSPYAWPARPIEIGPLVILLVWFSYTGCPASAWGILFLKELLDLGQISWFKWDLAQGPILHPHNHEAQDRVCPLGLMPIISGHAGDLWNVSYWVQDMQVAALHLNGAGRAFGGGFLQSSYCCCSDLVVYAQSFWHTPRQRHPGQGVHINVSLPWPIVQLKIVDGKVSHPSVTHGIQLCHH